MNAPARTHRGTIALEDAEILEHHAWPGAQYILRVAAPRCAARARPGSFAHVTCDPLLPMRRPLSIMRVDRNAGWVEFLYKTHGHGLTLLSRRRPGESLSLLGPIGVAFRPDPERPRPLLLGGGVGIPPMIFLAEALAGAQPAASGDSRPGPPAGGWQPLVLMGSELEFPFELDAAPAPVAGIGDDATAALSLLERIGVPSRLTSRAGLSGCHDGLVTGLARQWLDSLDDAGRAQVSVHACGPTPMLRAVAALAHEYALPCEVSLEEYMACAVGGCAGCVVRVDTPAGPAMKRVCVDGPVFDARSVFA